MKKSVQILTESGDGIGFGHLVRMSVLAKALRKAGLNCDCVTDHHGARNPDLLQDWEVRSWRNEASETGHIIIVDSYLADAEVYKALYAQSEFLVAIDDYERMDYVADLTLNPNPYAIGQFGGADYVLIREEMSELTVPRTTSGEINRVTVTLGGVDLHGLLPEVVRQAAETILEVEVICGTPERAAIVRSAVSNSAVTVHGFLGGVEMRRLFDRSDVVVSACGQTLHELACQGCPAIGFRVGEDQERNQAYYLEAGFLGARLTWTDSSWPTGFRRELEALRDPNVRRQRGAAGRGRIDGHGASRLAALAKTWQRPPQQR